MSAPRYMKFVVADYLADTTDLSCVEHGAYLLLLMGLWRAGGRLPANDVKLAKLARLSDADWAAVRPVVIALFKRRGGHLTHKRMNVELAEYANHIGKSKKGGLASAAQRANNNSGKTDLRVEPEPKQLEEETEEEGEKKTSKLAGANLSPGAGDEDLDVVSQPKPRKRANHDRTRPDRRANAFAERIGGVADAMAAAVHAVRE